MEQKSESVNAKEAVLEQPSELLTRYLSQMFI